MYLAILLVSVLCASAGKQYCVACEKRHSATRWHFDTGIAMCHKTYVSWTRSNLPGKPHPGHVVLNRYSKSLDSTNRRIVALKYRIDAMTFRDGYVLLGRLKGWTLAQRLWLLGIVGQLYWSWPMFTALSLIGKKPFSEVYQPSYMNHILTTILAMYGGLKIRQGVLVRSNASLCSPLTNPSERASGVVRYRKLMGQPARWYCACKALARLLKGGGEALLPRMVEVLRQNSTNGYPGRPDYGHIRICRLFLYAMSYNEVDCEEEWKVYRKCSRCVKKEYERLGIKTYAQALTTRNFMRQLLGMPRYSLSDLTVYICLRTRA